ncbi:hydroxyisourate hydrolase [Rhodococcus sp. 14C212]|uniref:hydroxyisourate hydrolase n=1 Tax=Rhodococcus sp. 14C212 TaxID=2711209 RepID=UPI0013ECA9BA|nr:hydroxyisourate hydrolase [Rhodococcus sp. 14C212]NGP09372.1 hydroxyisourate hydrolase [Rhodococcus sp. 14C212]
MSTLGTHVLDATTGTPAAGVHVVLADADGTVLGTGRTDADGRISALTDGPLPPGTYTLTFGAGDWFAERDIDSFYPEVVVTFRISLSGKHVHVPLLLSPFAYSTYRGS